MTPINKVLLGAGGAVALVVGVVFVWLFISNAHLEARLAQAEARENACALANDEFVQHVKRQNTAIEQLKKESMLREQRAASALAKAKDAGRKYLEIAERIQEAQMQGTACQTAEALFQTYLGADR